MDIVTKLCYAIPSRVINIAGRFDWKKITVWYIWLCHAMRQLLVLRKEYQYVMGLLFIGSIWSINLLGDMRDKRKQPHKVLYKTFHIQYILPCMSEIDSCCQNSWIFFIKTGKSSNRVHESCVARCACFDDKRHLRIWSLTHLPLDKMTAISQTVFSDAFLWTKSFVL